jgi:hypothetical protein
MLVCRYLGGNDLTGTMPTELGLMTSMERMYASTTSTLRVALNDDGC